ncbi:formylglycine-generating enzyme family protein [Adhaeretor mobilis]|uniref:Serine/threonine-protein kinase pkn1 n=1 Tax=Adhaeretor mobilis TaxID=1930276 RepID=A0A517MWI0_9BACT|nr:formylglycine-generating enzyme family protein [Adhaeretor mobilis]QDS99167.1 Serine/threonine-protein kinase pkn1 [Adhaeretor mobilis]
MSVQLLRKLSWILPLACACVCCVAKEPTPSDVNATEAYSTIIPGSAVSFEMVPIAGGEFQIGSPASEPGHQDDESPQVTIRVKPFWMGKHEVTWAEYHLFMELCNIFERFNDAGIRQVTSDNQIDAVTAPSKLYEPSFTYDSGDDPQQPAVSMTQYAAKQYTKWLSLLTGTFYRLPTEAEWEYACRAGTASAFSFGDDPNLLTEYAWYYENAEDDYATSRVGLHEPNSWGLYNMHGNVSEWVLDQYDPEHYAKFAGRTVDAGDFINWPTKLFPLVLRGGSWSTESAAECRSAARRQSGDEEEWKSNDPNTPKSPWWFASDYGQTVGFRIVRPVVPPPRAEWEKYWEADLEQIVKHVDRRIDKEGRGERGLVDPQLPEAIKQQEQAR